MEIKNTKKNYLESWAYLEDKDEEAIAKGKTKIPSTSELEEFLSRHKNAKCC
jgi:hypothetical protein